MLDTVTAMLLCAEFCLSLKTVEICFARQINLYLLGYVNCFDVWVPHKLSEKNFLTVSLHAVLY